MRHHKRRDSQEYFNELKSKLNPDVLMSSAYETDDGTKIISIDFFGIAATTLFDAGGNYSKTNIYKEFKELLENHEELNKKGYFLKIRLLFEYPYSISSYSRIQAEYNSDRASIEETSFLKQFNLTEQIDQELFLSSNLVSNQKASLMRLQSVMDDLQDKKSWKGNKINLRFTPVNPSFCCLFINKTAYFDVYLMAKRDRHHNSLEPFSPICVLEYEDGQDNVDNDKDEFDAFKDHFRYLWNLDTTMHYLDATKYTQNKVHSLSKLKPPADILNDYRADKVLSYVKHFTQDDAKRWATISRKNVQKFCVDLTPATFEEVMFVTCSWIRDVDKEPMPNLVAEELVMNMLNDDYTYQGRSIIEFKILRAATNDYLDDQLYSGLNKATLGLIILTKDIESKDGKFYCRPNVYHELGYLMNRLSRKKILILKEDGVELPTNVQNIPYISFNRKDLVLQYQPIIDAIRNICRYNDLVQVQAYRNHLERLQNSLNDGNIEQKEYTAAKRKLSKAIKDCEKDK